jgi:hypothetical protein
VRGVQRQGSHLTHVLCRINELSASAGFSILRSVCMIVDGIHCYKRKQDGYELTHSCSDLTASGGFLIQAGGLSSRGEIAHTFVQNTGR